MSHNVRHVEVWGGEGLNVVNMDVVDWVGLAGSCADPYSPIDFKKYFANDMPRYLGNYLFYLKYFPPKTLWLKKNKVEVSLPGTYFLKYLGTGVWFLGNDAKFLTHSNNEKKNKFAHLPLKFAK